jgi:hypothetical protein
VLEPDAVSHVLRLKTTYVSPLPGGVSPGGSGDFSPGNALIVTPDGHFVYALVVRGELTRLTATSDGLGDPYVYRDFVDGARGLSGSNGVDLTPDGHSLFVSSIDLTGGPGTLAAFTVNDATGALGFVNLLRGPYAGEGDGIRVTINEGAEYTNDADVRLRVTGATDMPLEVSNDGGFAPVSRVSRASDGTYHWRLASTGPDRLPKTVYVRQAGFFAGGTSVAQAQIVFDERPPAVLGLSVVGKRARRSAAAAVRVRARDANSGVAVVQFAQRRSAPSQWRRFTSRTTYRLKAGRLWVRVADAAGNVSRWRRLKVPA